MQIRPRRSMLYMPGSNARALEKARSLKVDSLIFDLEDAVAPDAKGSAREQIVAAVNEGGYGAREVIVRVNGLDSSWGRDDVAAIAPLPVDGVLFPKIDFAAQVHEAVEALDEAGGRAELSIWLMAETPLGMLNMQAITASSPRLAGIVMGTSDLAKELRVRHTAERTGLLTALSLCVLAARAHGLAILDGVHLDLNNLEEFRALCKQGLEMGFDGKTLIHPKQIEIANEVFSPSAQEIAQAKEIIQAWKAAQAEGKGVVVVNGRLVENLHVEEARRTLALAEAAHKEG